MSIAEELKNKELYWKLSSVFHTLEGNLLELSDDQTMEAQINFFRYLLGMVKPKAILETGTNKGFFSYIVSHLIGERKNPVKIYTFDVNDQSAGCVNLINKNVKNVRVYFEYGDSKQTLSKFHKKGIGMAWIDGGHMDDTSYSDIKNAIRLRIPYIAIDDYKTFPTDSSDPFCPNLPLVIRQILHEHPEYKEGYNPFFEQDARGAILLEKRI